MVSHNLPNSATIIVFIFCFFFSIAFLTASARPNYRQLGIRIPLKEKMSHLHFYFHDIVSGRNPTAINIVRPRQNITAENGFGNVAMIDDPLTERPELSSKLIGRAQGFYALDGQLETTLLMVVNYVFVEGKYKGSTLSILGRNAPMEAVREMPVVGGSGLFRLARGYAVARTHWYDSNTGDATVEYNVYVIHY